MKNPKVTVLDAGEIKRLSFDEDNDSYRVSLVAADKDLIKFDTSELHKIIKTFLIVQIVAFISLSIIILIKK